ncbi:GCN5-related N-acetyltransferase [Candidatus Moduliflexus flocculans]|uniref:GCN5-related N-acetyltransferase n=1 Tax=Candidatus Moduliflexus flocculans TaxID=1499966 RepID=A0A0S6W525_9BACT|nr:GCN5-related N-acetyltransferase [Candidatus Moduliflexus flocculans]
MNMTIRTEHPGDYNQIAEINELAFYSMLDATQRSYVVEVALVALLRHGRDYDPELAFVAEHDGKIVGHALYYPYHIRVGGETLRAVSLAPIAVHPEYQKQGIGQMLMAVAHQRAAAKGYAFAFLLGHPTYYHKFGYQTGMFGACRLKVAIEQITGTAEGVQERLIQPADIPAFAAMWHDWFDDVDLALFPGDSLMEWVSHAAHIKSYAVERNGELLGYLRYHRDNPADVKLFLAKDKETASLLLAHLRSKLEGCDETRLRLPLYPNSRAVKAYLSVPYESHVEAWDAAMIKILDEKNATIAAYCNEVKQGNRQPGLLIYPPAIEIAE